MLSVLRYALSRMVFGPDAIEKKRQQFKDGMPGVVPDTQREYFTLPQEVTARLCGHRFVVHKKMTLVIRGASVDVEWDGNPRSVEYCPDCIAAAAVPCVLCKGIIFPGEEIMLPHIPPEHAPCGAAAHPGNEFLFVACLGCAEMPLADKAGFWECIGGKGALLEPPGEILFTGTEEQKMEYRMKMISASALA